MNATLALDTTNAKGHPASHPNIQSKTRKRGSGEVHAEGKLQASSHVNLKMEDNSSVCKSVCVLGMWKYV